MNKKLTNYLEDVFAPYNNVKSIMELKNDLMLDLQERFMELKAEGKDERTAFDMTVESIGDIEGTLVEMSNLTNTLKRKVLVNFSAQELTSSDFAGVILHGGKFNCSVMKGADFSSADLTGSSFKCSDLSGAIFDRANLTDCSFSLIDLKDLSFKDTIMVRTVFNKAMLTDVKFIRVNLIDVSFSMSDLRKASFEDCIIEGGDFKNATLQGMCFDGVTIRNADLGKADLTKVSFQNATLQNVSFAPPFALTNKYYKVIKTIDFNGAIMDKLTHNSLKGLCANLDGVKVN